MIDGEVRAIIDGCYEEARRILVENMDILHSCAALLIEKAYGHCPFSEKVFLLLMGCSKNYI